MRYICMWSTTLFINLKGISIEMAEVGVNNVVVDRMDIDLEMQLLPIHNNGNSNSNNRPGLQILHTATLVVRSALILIAGTNHTSPTLSRASSSNTTHQQTAVRFNDNMEEVAAVEDVVDAAQTAPLLLNNGSRSRQQLRTLFHVLYTTQLFRESAASSPHDHNAYVHPGANQTTPEVAEGIDTIAFSSEKTSTNQMTHDSQLLLHHSQRQNISKMVREKNLRSLQEFGGLSGVAVALNTDLERGISENEAVYHSQVRACSPISTPTQKFSHLVLEALKNKTILFLFLAAVLSLAFEIKEEGPQNGWLDGVVVLVTIVLLVLIASIRKFRQQRRVQKKLEKHQVTKRRVEDEVHVIRDGEAKYICESRLVWGDVVLLKKGSQVPADGLFIDGQALEVDYGSESCKIDEHNPFLSYGERVIDGDARIVVTSINMETGWSEMMSKANDPNTRFKLETHLDKWNAWIHYTVLGFSILIILVLFFRYMARKIDEQNVYKIDSMAEPTEITSFTKAFKKIIKESKYTTRALTKLLCVSLVGLTEGVPFTVSLAIFYWNDVALSGKATEKDAQVVAKMASVTRICTSLSGDFTEDEMEVENLFIGGQVISGCTTLSPHVVQALCDGICTLNENAVLMNWGKEKWGLKSERSVMQSVMNLYENETGKEVLNKCRHYYNVKGEKAPMDHIVRTFFKDANEHMLHKQLRTIVFACKCTDTQTLDADHDLVLVALLGLKNKSREVTKEQVKACRECGMEFVIVSSEPVSVLEDNAIQCGVITNGSASQLLVITGEVFRKFSDDERIEKVDKIRVLGEALPFDKFLFVETLRKKGEVVAFLGQRTDEAPTLMQANIGMSMGSWSSRNARDYSDVFISEGGFYDLINMLNSGKCIYQDVQRFIQLVLITTISNTLISFFETTFFGDASLTMVHLVFVNLTMAFVGGLALLTKSSTDKVVSPHSYGSRSFMTAEMMRNIVCQVLYQVICLVILRHKGFPFMGTSQNKKTMVCNSFILCLLFNLFNARELQNNNFFRGIYRHKQFWIAVATFVVLLGVLVVVQDSLGYVQTLDSWEQWVGCVVVGATSWLVDWLGKCISAGFT